MPTFSGQRYSFTPATGVGASCNWTLDFGVTAGTFGKVIEIGWGGMNTTSSGYSTRWVRPTTAGAGTRTNLTLGYHQPNYASAGGVVTTSYATTQPTLPAVAVGDLWAQDWNSQGGVGVIVMPLANPWWCSNGVLTGAISCINVSGTDANLSSYSVVWEE